MSGASQVNWDHGEKREYLEENKLKRGTSSGAVNNLTGETYPRSDQGLEVAVLRRGSPSSGG